MWVPLDLPPGWWALVLVVPLAILAVRLSSLSWKELVMIFGGRGKRPQGKRGQ